MPDPRTTGDGTVTLTEGTRFDLKTGLVLAGVIVSGALAWGEQKLALFKQDAQLRAEIVTVQNNLERSGEASDKAQDGRIIVIENRLANIDATTCAIARKLDVPTVGCGRRDP